MSILDQHGNPLQQRTLSRQQSEDMSSLLTRVAHHPARGLTPSRLNQILESAERGDLIAQHELFRDIEERDGHIFSELSKRKRAVIKLDWDVVPPRNPSKAEVAAAAYAKDLLLDLSDFEDLLFDCLDGIAHGFAAVELEWTRLGNEWTVAGAHHRPQSWFQTDLATRTHLRLRNNTPEGADLQPFGWILHTHRAMSGYPARMGLSRVLVWPYIFKAFSVGDLAEFLDIYGMPLRVGKYPANATDKEKAALWQAVAGIGHNAAGIIPATMQVEFEEAAKGGEKPFEAMIGWCERSASKAILGSTLTSDAAPTGLGSGLAEIHNEVRLDIRDSDCKQLASTITRHLIYPLLALNSGWADVRRCPRLVFDTAQAGDLKLFADALPKLVSNGMQISVQWAHERLRIPMAADGDVVLKSSPPGDGQKAPPAKPAKNARLSAALAALSAQFPDQDLVDGAVEDLEPGLQALSEAWLKPALAALRSAPTAQAALELLASENPLTDDAVLTEAIARALFVVELLGEDSARQELGE
jgi:phage gp29-like protein